MCVAPPRRDATFCHLLSDGSPLGRAVGELRGAENERIADETSVCFICGIDRATFDRNGVSFSSHIKKEHNLWAYVNMLVHLRTKSSTDFNGWESHIWDKLPENRNDAGA